MALVLRWNIYLIESQDAEDSLRLDHRTLNRASRATFWDDEVEGKAFESRSGAAFYICQKSRNGWECWPLDPSGGRLLDEVRAEYLRVVSPEDAEAEDDASGESN